MLKALFTLKPNILTEFIRDESDVNYFILLSLVLIYFAILLIYTKVDYPIYFFALASKLSADCLKQITPEANTICDVSHLFYRGMSFLRYSIEIGVDVDILEYLLDVKYSSRDVLTVKDPVNIFIYLLTV